MQLLMTESYEFGHHRGLDIIEGPVVSFNHPMEGGRRLKVPQIGWNAIWQPKTTGNLWSNTLLDGIADGTCMYFVHSYIVQPLDPDILLSTSTYGQIEFCSSLRRNNVFACQFHPERSWPKGLKIYQNLGSNLMRRKQNGGLND
jgi:glutamine amidotransferase